jgi:hypothetical protein
MIVLVLKNSLAQAYTLILINHFTGDQQKAGSRNRVRWVVSYLSIERLKNIRPFRILKGLMLLYLKGFD